MSMNSFEQLMQVIPIPQTPHELPSDTDWKATERSLSLLPRDFKDIISNYGTGSIASFIWLFNPASANQHLNMNTQVVLQLQNLAMSNLSTLKLFPQPGGMLPFGITDNGELLGWETYGDPNTWSVVVVSAREDCVEAFPKTCSEFLCGVLTRGIICSLFPQDFPPTDISFTLIE